MRFISPTPLSDGQQSGCAGQTPSLPWGWSRCAGAGLDLECSSQLEAVKMNNGSALGRLHVESRLLRSQQKSVK